MSNPSYKPEDGFRPLIEHMGLQTKVEALFRAEGHLDPDTRYIIMRGFHDNFGYLEMWSWVPQEPRSLRFEESCQFTGQYHHQIRSPQEELLGYAITTQKKNEDVVVEVSPGVDLARNLDNAHLSQKQRLSEFSARWARLLLIPHLQVKALWVPGTEVLVVEGPKQILHHFYKEEDFVEVLLKHAGALEFWSQAAKDWQDNPARMKDLERWHALLRSELERVLSIFMAPTEAKDAVGNIGTPEFDQVVKNIGGRFHELERYRQEDLELLEYGQDVLGLNNIKPLALEGTPVEWEVSSIADFGPASSPITFIPCRRIEVHHGLHQWDGKCLGCLLEAGEEPRCRYCGDLLKKGIPCDHSKPNLD